MDDAASIKSQSRGFWLLLGLMMLFAAGKAVLHDTMDPDFFWHMRVAEQLQREGVGPLVDQISFSTSKTPWTPYSWLGELGMKWLWDHAGLRGAIATQALLEAIFVMLVALCAMQRSGDRSYFPALISTAFCIYLFMPYLSFRPVLAALVLLALCALLLLRDRRLGESTRAIWIVPVLTAITINLHLFAVFVPMWVGALLIGAVIERDKPHVRRYAILLALCLLACCCTPMLRGTIVSIREYALSNPLTDAPMISEMAPMYRSTGRLITLAVIIVICVCAAMRRTVRAGEWLWLAGMFVLFVKTGRAAPLFAPIFALVMSSGLRMSDRVLGKRPVQALVACIVLVGLIRIVLSLPNNANPDAWFNRRGDEFKGYPAAAADFVRANVPRRHGKLINEFDWGGYLAWKLPEFQVLLDGRTQLFSPEFWHAAYLDGATARTKFLSTIEADAAILPAGKSRFRDALEELGWKRVYNDARAEVLIPKN